MIINFYIQVYYSQIFLKNFFKIFHYFKYRYICIFIIILYIIIFFLLSLIKFKLSYLQFEINVQRNSGIVMYIIVNSIKSSTKVFSSTFSTINSVPLGKMTSYSPGTDVIFSTKTALHAVCNFIWNFCLISKDFLTVILKITFVANSKAFCLFIVVERISLNLINFPSLFFNSSINVWGKFAPLYNSKLF